MDELSPRAILCLGQTAGGYVRRRFEANTVVAQFVERNNRRWKSQMFESGRGIRVIVATHASIADWCAPSTDPSELVRDALR